MARTGNMAAGSCPPYVASRALRDMERYAVKRHYQLINKNL